MTPVHGQYYDGRSSAGVPADLIFHANGFVHLQRAAGETVYRFEQLRFSERVGSTPRHVYFPDGGQLETPDNATVDAVLAARHQQQGARWLNRLESRWHFVLLAVVLIGALAWSTLRYGLPAAARAAAFALPAETSAAIGRGTLELLDRSLLAPTQLDAATRKHVQYVFDGVARQESALPLHLEFRAGQRIGANALALPDGTVVITDEMIKLVRDDAELVAVLAHEAGHLAQRHALRRAIQSSVVAMLTVLVTGDVSATSGLIAALPTALVESSYSQAFEYEADQHARDHLRARHLDPKHFVDLMERLEQTHPDHNIPNWLSTHPPHAERLRRFTEPAQPPVKTNK